MALGAFPVYSFAMSQETRSDADRMIARLAALGDLRVWSVIITIFGDAVLPRGGTVAATTLARIVERMDIKPEALRVALFRLARDGWLIRTKQGRNSFYRLSESGIANFQPATKRIYAAAPALQGPWYLAVADPGGPDLSDAMTAAGFLPAHGGVFIGPAGAGPAPEGVLVAEGELPRLPDWLRAAFGPPDLAADYARLSDGLAALRADLEKGPPPDPLDAVALRTLVVHQWRRLLLRHPDLPERFFPRDWPGETCRARVLALHAALTPLARPWLDAEIGASEPARGR